MININLNKHVGRLKAIKTFMILDLLNFSVLLLGVVICVSYAHLEAMYFGGYPYDGPFQTLYSLRKLSIGEIPGKDFFFFHGNGIPFIHYPIFSLFGKNLYASHLSEIVIHHLAILLPSYLLMRKLTNSSYAILFVNLWIMLSCLNFLGYPYLSSLSLFQPLSTFGIRTLMVFVMAHLLHYLMVCDFNKRDYIIYALICMLNFPLFILLGTEHGVYTSLTLCIFIFCGVYIKQNLYFAALLSASTIIGGVLTTVIAHYLLFGSIDALREISYVMGDQSWYFGTYPHLFIRDLFDIVSSPHPQYSFYRVLFIITILTIALLGVTIKLRLIDKPQIIVFVSLLFEAGVGLTSNLGYVSIHYGSTLLRADILILFVCIKLSLERYINIKSNHPSTLWGN